MREENYTEPRIYRGSRQWYVEFYFRNPDAHVFERIKIRGKINYEKDLAKRERLAAHLQRALLKGLKDGKKPLKFVKLMDEPKKYLVATLADISKSEGKGKSQDTRNAYKLYIGRLQKFLAHQFDGADDILLEDFTEERAQEFGEYMIEEMEWKNATINCTIQPLKQFLEILFKKHEIRINPFYNVKYLPKQRGITFIAFDTEEKKRITEELSMNHPLLHLYVNLIYSCFIRPKELCALRVSDIDLKDEWVRVRMQSSKVSHTSHRQLMPAVKELILNLGIHKRPKDALVFEDLCGSDASLRIRRRKVTEMWRRIVKDAKTGLGINKEMYGMKHTGNIDFLKGLDNIGEANLIWLQRQNDHTNLETTQIYIRDLGVYKMKKEHLPFGVL